MTTDTSGSLVAIPIRILAARTKRGSFLIDWSDELQEEVDAVGTDLKEHDVGVPPTDGIWSFTGNVENHGEFGLKWHGLWSQVMKLPTEKKIQWD